MSRDMGREKMGKIKITSGKGFQLTFRNGITVSVQIGFGNYCSNKENDRLTFGNVECPNAEVAVWDITGKDILSEYLTENGDEALDEIGWVSADTVGLIINWARKREK